MRIVTNAIPLLSPRTGVGQYVYNICKRLEELEDANEYTYFYGYYSDTLIGSPANSGYKTGKIKDKLRKIPLAGRLMPTIKEKLARIDGMVKQVGCFDLYFEPNFIPLSGIKAKKKIVTVHDLSFKLFPHWFPTEENRFFNKRFDHALGNIDHFITVSHYVKHEMIQNLGLEESQISVVYNGYDSGVFRIYKREVVEPILSKYEIDRPYILFVGTLEPRKNVTSLLKAYQELPSYLKKEFKLVVAGSSGWLNDDIFSFVKSQRLKETVVFTGYIPDHEVACLMNGASVFVYPSFYEGFGLPPLEAMACGTPVIVSNTTSMKELYKGLAYLVDPYEFDSIARGLEELLNNESLYNELVDKGLDYVKDFSWDSAAMNTWEVFKDQLFPG